MKEKSKFYKQGRSIWWNYLRSHPGIYLFGVVSVFVTNLMQVFIARLSGVAIDLFEGKAAPPILSKVHFINWSDSKGTFWQLVWAMAIFQIVVFLGRVLWRLSLARQTHYANSYLRGKVWQSARFVQRDLLDSTITKGVLLNASNSDVGAAKFLFGFTLVGMADFIFLTTMTLMAMMAINPSLALWSFVAMIPLPFVAKWISQREIHLFDVAQNKLSDFNDLAAQAVGSIRMQRLTQTGSFWKRRLNLMAEDYRMDRLNAVFSSLRWFPTMGSASLLCTAVLFILGVTYVGAGKMSVGDFIAMQSLIFLIQDPLTELGFIISDWRRGMTGLARLCEIYMAPQDRIYTDNLGQEKIDLRENHQRAILECKNVSVSMDQGQSFTFKDFDLTIKAQERLGVCGPIGSGKTTLVNLLSGLKRDFDGEILFCGQPFNHYKHDDLRQYIGVVSQSPFLFADTVKKNVAVGQEDMHDEEIWHYLEMAGLKEDVEQMPHGLHTSLGEWGINLSGGQKQRLCLARALARKPKLLFLDDCLSAVDTVTEEKILRYLDQHMKETTVIWMAHRKSTLKYCDRIMELGDGQ